MFQVLEHLHASMVNWIEQLPERPVTSASTACNHEYVVSTDVGVFDDPKVLCKRCGWVMVGKPAQPRLMEDIEFLRQLMSDRNRVGGYMFGSGGQLKNERGEVVLTLDPKQIEGVKGQGLIALMYGKIVDQFCVNCESHCPDSTLCRECKEQVQSEVKSWPSALEWARDDLNG